MCLVDWRNSSSWGFGKKRVTTIILAMGAGFVVCLAMLVISFRVPDFFVLLCRSRSRVLGR